MAESTPNVGTIFAHHVAGNRPALVDLSQPDAPRELTYRELDATCNAVARGLVRRGLGTGDRIGLLALNSAEYVATLFGAMKAGCVPVPLNAKLSADALAYVCRDAEIRLIFCDAAFARVCPAGLPRVEFDGNSEERFSSFVDPGPFTAVAVAPNEVCIQPYTSGSTGRPKGVLLSHAGQAWGIPAGTTARHLKPDDRVLVAAPLCHKYGLLQLKYALCAGSTVVLHRRFDPRLYIESIGRHAITSLTGVATMYSMVLAEPELLDTVDCTGVRSISVGSSPFAPLVFEGLAQRFPSAAPFNGYGITEAGGGVFGGHPNGPRRPLKSLGYPLPGVEVRLIGGPSPDEGVMLIRSKGVMLGYQNLPEESARRLRDGWLDTGDVCRRDADGFYYFIRRADEMFKCGGENVYPREVEEVLERHPDVVQAVVIAVDHEIKGQVPVAFVVPRRGTWPSEDLLKTWALENGPSYQHPRRVFVEQRLPVAGTGKVDKAKLRARALLAEIPVSLPRIRTGTPG